MAGRTLAAILLLLMLVALISTRPWRGEGGRWSDESALLAALLLGGLLITLT